MTTRAPSRARRRPARAPASARRPGGAARPAAPKRRTKGPSRPAPRRAPEIDPRIRARRIAVSRAAGRRRLRRLLVVLAVAVVTGAAAVAAWSPLLDVDRVVVRGAGPRAGAVQAAADVDPGSALLFVDTGAVAERVEELAWVARASVTRQLPGTLRITVELRPPVAYAARADGTFALVDATGAVTDLAAAPPPGLPALATDAPVQRPGGAVRPRAAARVAGLLGPLAGQVSRVSVDRGEGALTLADGRIVRLGDLTHVTEKARAAAAVLGAPGLPPIGYVDVRVPSAPVTG